VIEIGPGRLVFDRRYTFRGDNDEAWVRAEAFVSRDVRAALAAAPPVSATAMPAPIKFAVFDFEQEDTSAAASSATASDDAAQLADVTGQVRRLLTQSGRYQLIDIGSADADAVKAHSLRDCGGCDAAIALKAGAEQSLVGVSSTVTSHGVPLLSYTRTMNRFYSSRKQKLSLYRFKCEVCGERIRGWAWQTPTGNRTHDGCYERLAWMWTNLYAQQQRAANEGRLD